MRNFLLLIQQECRLSGRERHEWLNPLLFFCMVLLVFPLSVSEENNVLSHYAPCFIWIAALFANLLAIQHFFTNDLQDGFLQQSMLAPLSFTLQIQAKCIAHCLMHIIPLLVMSFFMALMFHLSFAVSGVLVISLLLGMPTLALISIFCAALTIGLRQQGVMMSIMVFPLIVPIIIFGTNIVLQYQAKFDIVGPLAFLAGLLVLAYTVLPWLISKTLRLVMY